MASGYIPVAGVRYGPTSRKGLEEVAFYDRWGDTRQAGDAYPETPRAFLTASPIGTKGFPSGVVARNIRLWVMATANRVSGSAHPIDPPAPGWPKVRGLLPAATIDRDGAASPMLATRWNPPMLPL